MEPFIWPVIILYCVFCYVVSYVGLCIIFAVYPQTQRKHYEDIMKTRLVVTRLRNGWAEDLLRITVCLSPISLPLICFYLLVVFILWQAPEYISTTLRAKFPQLLDKIDSE